MENPFKKILGPSDNEIKEKLSENMFGLSEEKVKTLSEKISKVLDISFESVYKIIENKAKTRADRPEDEEFASVDTLKSNSGVLDKRYQTGENFKKLAKQYISFASNREDLMALIEILNDDHNDIKIDAFKKIISLLKTEKEIEKEINDIIYNASLYHIPKEDLQNFLITKCFETFKK
jgi:hypothetical protein